jgi:hypothetical protein
LRRFVASTPSPTTTIPTAKHDFGAIDEGGERYFWKIDSYDRATDPAATTRVLTIMRADEY